MRGEIFTRCELGRAAAAYGGRSALDAIGDGEQDLVLAELRDSFDWSTAA